MFPRESRGAIVELVTHPACALVVFAIVGLTLWSAGNGIPYGYDSADRYATYLAAYNAVTFEAENPLLQDQLATPDSAAHPSYVNQPPSVIAGLVSQALIRAGVTDLRFHDLAAVGLGLVGAYVAFLSMRRIGGAILATVVTLVFSFHYIGMLTWTGGISGALDLVLFWGVMYLVLRYVASPTRAWLVAIAGAMFVVFLNDYTLALFIICTAVFLVLQAGLSGRSKAVFAVACALAALVALVLWTWMEVAALGFDAVQRDALRSVTAIPTGWAAISGAYRTAFQLGQGALAVVVYPLILAAILTPLVGRVTGRPGLVPCVLIAGAIAVALWTRLTDEWEVVPGLPLARGVLLVVLAATLVCAWWAVSGRHTRLFDPWAAPSGATGGRVTVAAFVIAAGVASLFVTWLAPSNPGLVFVEDVVLAAALLAVCRFALRWRQHLLASVGATLLVAFAGGYWLAHQAKLIVEYPPLELSVAPALRNNPAVQSMSFVTPAEYPVVWYYTRGEGHTVNYPAIDGDVSRPPQLFICTGHANPEAAVPPCDAWKPLLASLGFPAETGGNFLQASGYLIYSTAAQPLSNLEPVPTVDSVKATLKRLEDGNVDLEATYIAHPFDDPAAPPTSPLLRLYRVDAAPCLVAATDASSSFQLPRDASGRFRISVTPRTTRTSGHEVFSDVVQIQLSSFTLPDIQTGGVQQVVAASLDEAERIALAAGTWNPAAGTLGAKSEPVPQSKDPGPPPSSNWAQTAC